MRDKKDHAEWLINRALKDGDNRKMRRALMVAVKINRWNGDFAKADEGMRQIAMLTRNMRKYRKWKAKEHPGATVSIEITEVQQ